MTEGSLENWRRRGGWTAPSWGRQRAQEGGMEGRSGAGPDVQSLHAIAEASGRRGLGVAGRCSRVAVAVRLLRGDGHAGGSCGQHQLRCAFNTSQTDSVTNWENLNSNKSLHSSIVLKIKPHLKKKLHLTNRYIVLKGGKYESYKKKNTSLESCRTESN